jgi:methionine synthase I (cobalamin-dependent)
MVNCAYPTFLCPEKQPASLFDRLIGFQANASSLDHCDLDGSDRLEQEDVSDWGDAMLALNESYGVKILGGCCGTTGIHLRYIVDHIDG